MTAMIMMGDGPDNLKSMLGGDSSNPTWDEYLDRIKDEYRPHFVAIRKAIEDYGLLGTKADNFCNNHWFKLSDGVAIAFSWRAWGDLMQAIVGKCEGHMRYYM